MDRRLLIVAVVLAVAAAAMVAYLVYGGGGGGIVYPERLPGGYGVVRVVSGSEAVRLVRGIHWEPSRVAVERAVVVFYSDGSILWASYVGGAACSLAERMAEKMAVYEGELPYTAPVPHRVGGVTVYLTLDKRDGSLHAFWCRGGLVVWVRLGAAGASDPAGLIGFLVEHVSAG